MRRRTAPSNDPSRPWRLGPSATRGTSGRRPPTPVCRSVQAGPAAIVLQRNRRVANCARLPTAASSRHCPHCRGDHGTNARTPGSDVAARVATNDQRGRCAGCDARHRLRNARFDARILDTTRRRADPVVPSCAARTQYVSICSRPVDCSAGSSASHSTPCVLQTSRNASMTPVSIPRSPHT